MKNCKYETIDRENVQSSQIINWNDTHVQMNDLCNHAQLSPMSERLSIELYLSKTVDTDDQNDMEAHIA
ncbi:MAG: hypothetical protein J07HQW2_00844 [Haloquadratum walsbyi J07HQW2]|uniref:Uncharacterized protein n=1 Tax=Haloquadratum walsbyi J07HQW2 TaxID=1238425 RepID=U1NBZ8_9EURY|nr:MAG: hypothetical protein J07HQW2_00844 [Haloquadratum walsbyi J07HQW2]